MRCSMNYLIKIENYVNLFFEPIPYSKKNKEIKEAVIKSLVKELEKKEFFEVIAEYNTLEKLCQKAGYEEKDIKKLKETDNLLSKEELKKSFKNARRSYYFQVITSIFAVVYLYNFCVTPSIGFILMALLFFFFSYRIGKKRKNRKELKETYSLDAYDYLKKLQDKYYKKTLNSFFFFILFLIYIILDIFIMRKNSKISELIESFNYILFYIEVGVLLFAKNILLAKWCSKKSGNTKWYCSFRNVIRFTGVFWGIYLIICALFKTNFRTIFFLFAIIYIIIAGIYILKYRGIYTYKNIVINKKRIAFYSIICLAMITYQVLQKDFWILQPYINSIPNIAQEKATITYNEENGVFTIINEKEEDFKILQLTDIHLGGSIFSFRKDAKALDTIYNLIKYTNPDFIIVTGDLTFPLGLFSFSINNHTPVMQFASFMRNIGIPWAFTYGNHDTEPVATYSKEELNNLYKALSYKTSKNLLYPYIEPNITGRNNQLIELRNKDNTLNQALFLIDSNAYTGEGLNKYDYIHDDQVEWYKENILRLEKEEQKKISSMVFFHIPLQEYKTAYELYEKGSNEVTYYFGENNEKLFDKVCASEYPSKMFEEALNLGSTKAFFCGHDHYNNMSLEYKGIRLTYGMSIDYLAMPGISKEEEQRGATLIQIKQDSSYEISQIPYTLVPKEN